jgi:hypothetical protein
MSRIRQKGELRSGFEYGLGLLVAATAAVCILQCLPYLSPINGTDKDFWHRSGVEIVTDYRTGVQYLKTASGITPRIDRDGVPVLGAKVGGQ